MKKITLGKAGFVGYAMRLPRDQKEKYAEIVEKWCSEMPIEELKAAKYYVEHGTFMFCKEYQDQVRIPIFPRDESWRPQETKFEKYFRIFVRWLGDAS